MTVLWQIFSRVYQLKNFENRSQFGKCMTNNARAWFSVSRCGSRPRVHSEYIRTLLSSVRLKLVLSIIMRCLLTVCGHRLFNRLIGIIIRFNDATVHDLDNKTDKSLHSTPAIILPRLLFTITHTHTGYTTTRS